MTAHGALRPKATVKNKIPGRDGDIILNHGRYKNVEVSYTVSFIGTKEQRTPGLIRGFLRFVWCAIHPDSGREYRCRDSVMC